MTAAMAVVDVMYQVAREDIKGFRAKARLSIGRDDEERPCSQRVEYFGSSRARNVHLYARESKPVAL